MKVPVVALLLLVPNVAGAILFTEGTLDGPCAWASVVKIHGDWPSGDPCSGTLISPRTVLTAGHCDYPVSANFGETNLDSSGEEASVDFEDCEKHFLYVSGTDGVDLQVCRVDINTPAPAVPTVPIMVPTGPARDWLYWELHDYNNDLKYFTSSTPEVVVVGAGLNQFNEGDDTFGNKLQGSAWLHRQLEKDGSNTKLQSGKEAGQGTFVQIHDGDSGGPMFLEMPDGSWRQIGVAHSSGGGLPQYHEAAPSWLRWIETNAESGADDIISPCHEYVDGDWVWQGSCADSFPVNPWESYDSDWSNDCAGVTYGGGDYPNAGVTPPAPGDKTPGPGGDGSGPWVAIQEFDDLYATALSMASSGGFGEIPTKSTIAAWFVEEIEPNATHLYLGSVKRAGIEGSYAEVVLTGDFDGDSAADTLYTDPYHDCGKGRFTVVLDDDTATEWTRDTTGVLGTAACNDHFGAAVAVGDFNNDGYDDVALAAPGATVSTVVQAGDLSVIYGSATGLTDSGDQLLSQNSSGILDSSETYDFFGESLVSADFNCDGYADVALGAPRDDYGTTFDAGMAHVLYGSSGGLSTVDSVWFQTGSVNGTVEEGDHFGSALAAGNFNGDADPTSGTECMDLAIGAPGEDLGFTAPIVDAGFVYVAPGGTSGLTTTGDLELHQDVTNVDDLEEANDRFGAVLGAVDDGTYWGLVVQVPGESCSSTSENVGSHRFYGSATGITTSSDALSCETFDNAFNSRDGGYLYQLADAYAIRVLADL